MLKPKPVVIDFEGFKHKNSEFVIKELSICSDYSDTIHFLPPIDFEDLSIGERRSYRWVSRFLHGLYWHRGEYSYSFIYQFFQSIVLRFPNGKFYAKGIQKCTVLSKFLQQPVINLEDLGCPKIELLDGDFPHCDRHSKLLPPFMRDSHCAQRKAQIFYDWLKNIYGAIDNEINGIEDSNIRRFECMSLAKL